MTPAFSVLIVQKMDYLKSSPAAYRCVWMCGHSFFVGSWLGASSSIMAIGPYISRAMIINAGIDGYVFCANRTDHL
jgi:hypothetical protein